MKGQSDPQKSARAIARRLSQENIPYAIAGALALGALGHERLTVDVDILITAEGLARFKARWMGRGYVEQFPGSKGLRDTENDVKIDFLISGEFPGDGKPKPVAFPDPAAAGTEAGGYRVVALSYLLEMKLASGMSAPHRLQDLADVLALIRDRNLPQDLSEKLHPFVRAKFLELWEAAQQGRGDEY